jgi:lipopolysaccharide/colanic/teichoic acid biosynthesis glycosyltransferase
LVRPGITDLASIEYRSESEILAKSDNPEHTYIQEILPAKLKLNSQYLIKISLFRDIAIIWRTIIYNAPRTGT